MPETKNPTATHPTAITPSTSTSTPPPTKTIPPTPTPTTSVHAPTPISPKRGVLLPHHHDLDDIPHFSPTALPHPSALPFLPKETGTNPSSRCSSVNPNDTLPPTPTPGPETQPAPYPPQMRIPVLPVVRDVGKSTTTEQEGRPSTHLLFEDQNKDDRAGTVNPVVVPTKTDQTNALPSRPAGEVGYGERRSGEGHPSGYRQDSGAMEKRGGEGEEETLLGKLGKWVEGVNSRIVDTAIAGDAKGKGKE